MPTALFLLPATTLHCLRLTQKLPITAFVQHKLIKSYLSLSLSTNLRKNMVTGSDVKNQQNLFEFQLATHSTDAVD
jgi:hypothetical protein